MCVDGKKAKKGRRAHEMWVRCIFWAKWTKCNSYPIEKTDEKSQFYRIKRLDLFNFKCFLYDWRPILILVFCGNWTYWVCFIHMLLGKCGLVLFRSDFFSFLCLLLNECTYACMHACMDAYVRKAKFSSSDFPFFLSFFFLFVQHLQEEAGPAATRDPSA